MKKRVCFILLMVSAVMGFAQEEISVSSDREEVLVDFVYVQPPRLRSGQTLKLYRIHSRRPVDRAGKDYLSQRDGTYFEILGDLPGAVMLAPGEYRLALGITPKRTERISLSVGKEPVVVRLTFPKHSGGTKNGLLWSGFAFTVEGLLLGAYGSVMALTTPQVLGNVIRYDAGGVVDSGLGFNPFDLYWGVAAAGGASVILGLPLMISGGVLKKKDVFRFEAIQ